MGPGGLKVVLIIDSNKHTEKMGTLRIFHNSTSYSREFFSRPGQSHRLSQAVLDCGDPCFFRTR